MSSGPHLNTRRAALRPAGHGLDIPDIDLKLGQYERTMKKSLHQAIVELNRHFRLTINTIIYIINEEQLVIFDAVLFFLIHT